MSAPKNYFYTKLQWREAEKDLHAALDKPTLAAIKDAINAAGFTGLGADKLEKEYLRKLLAVETASSVILNEDFSSLTLDDGSPLIL